MSDARESRAPLPLDGIRVLDVTQGIIGGLCTSHLAALGADVCKVEPNEGDWLREVGPTEGQPTIFEVLSRSKSGVRLPLCDAAKATNEFAVLADVVVVDDDDPWHGINEEEIKAVNERVVWASISGRPPRGIGRPRPVSELTTQVAFGVHRQLGREGGEVVRAGFDIASCATGLSLCCGILAALHEREESGRGQAVTVAMYAAMVSLLEWNLTSEHAPDEWIGVQLAAYLAPPNNGFSLADGSAHVDFPNDLEGWDRFVIATGCAELMGDPRFSDAVTLRLNMAEFRAELAPALADWTYDELDRVVRECGGTVVPLVPTDDALRFAEDSGLFARRSGDHFDCAMRPWQFSGFDLRSASAYEEKVTASWWGS